MSEKFYIEKSEDYGYSWERHTTDYCCSRDEIKQVLLDYRESLAEAGGNRRKTRFRINLIEPERTAPELAYVASWCAGLHTGLRELIHWLEENYKGRKVEYGGDTVKVIGANASLSGVSMHDDPAKSIDVFLWDLGNNITIKLSELKNLKLE